MEKGKYIVRFSAKEFKERVYGKAIYNTIYESEINENDNLSEVTQGYDLKYYDSIKDAKTDMHMFADEFKNDFEQETRLLVFEGVIYLVLEDEWEVKERLRL